MTIIKPITATAWGTKGFYIEDADGYIIGFGGRPAAANNRLHVVRVRNKLRRLSTLGYHPIQVALIGACS